MYTSTNKYTRELLQRSCTPQALWSISEGLVSNCNTYSRHCAAKFQVYYIPNHLEASVPIASQKKLTTKLPVLNYKAAVRLVPQTTALLMPHTCLDDLCLTS
jgi:hypothetical protein